MKIPRSKRQESGRATVTRTFTLYPEQQLKLINAEEARRATEKKANVSLILQELIDQGLDVSTGRVKSYLDARDAAVEFEQDVATVLRAAGLEVRQQVTLKTKNGEKGHIVDMVVEGKVIVELKSSGRRDRLELALGQALILKGQSGMDVVVCVPAVTEAKVAEIFRMAGIGLVAAGELVEWVRRVLNDR